MANSDTRIHAFDALRGLAACAVVISHLLLVMRGQQDAAYASFYQWIQTFEMTPLRLLWAGQAAVVLFFTLSGFVLYLMLDRARLSLPAYATKRLVRLYIPYLAAIALGILGTALVGSHSLTGFNGWINKFWSWPISFKSVAEQLLFVGQFNADRYDFTSWTLVHEMRISLLFPLLFIMVRRLHWCAALAPFVVISATLIIVRQPAFNIASFMAGGGLTAWMYSLHYLLAFAIGASLAHQRRTLLSYYANLPLRWRIGWWLACLLLLTYGGRSLSWLGLVTLMPYDWPLMLAAALLLIGVAAEPAVRRCLERPSLLYLGRISYSLYLFHPLVLLAMLHVFVGRLPLGVILLATPILSLIVSDLAYRLLERPSIALARQASTAIERLYAGSPKHQTL